MMRMWIGRVKSARNFSLTTGMYRGSREGAGGREQGGREGLFPNHRYVDREQEGADGSREGAGERGQEGGREQELFPNHRYGEREQGGGREQGEQAGESRVEGARGSRKEGRQQEGSRKERRQQEGSREGGSREEGGRRMEGAETFP